MQVRENSDGQDTGNVGDAKNATLVVGAEAAAVVTRKRSTSNAVTQKPKQKNVGRFKTTALNVSTDDGSTPYQRQIELPEDGTKNRVKMVAILFRVHDKDVKSDDAVLAATTSERVEVGGLGYSDGAGPAIDYGVDVNGNVTNHTKYVPFGIRFVIYCPHPRFTFLLVSINCRYS